MERDSETEREIGREEGWWLDCLNDHKRVCVP